MDSDLLQIKIEKAKMELPEETRNAIAAVDWKAVILGLRTKTGFSFEQLGELETETELLLAGLVDPGEYPKELETRMRITKTQVDSLVKDMNDLVFAKIRQELVKQNENKGKGVQPVATAAPKVLPVRSIPSNPLSSTYHKKEEEVWKQSGIEIKKPFEIAPVSEKAIGPREDVLQKIEIAAHATIPPPMPSVSSFPAQKLASSFQIPTAKTEYTLSNISKSTPAPAPATPKPSMPAVDPYRLPPE